MTFEQARWARFAYLILALLGHYVDRYRKSMSAVRAADRRDVVGEEAQHDGAAHRRQAGGWWRSRNAAGHFSPAPSSVARRGGRAAAKRRPCRSSARAGA